MKAVFAVLLLLSQLQPVLGTVVCLGLSDRPTKQECKMPDHGQMPGTSVTMAGAAAQGCQSAAICAPAPLAIPAWFTQLETVTPLLDKGASLAPTLLGISPAPPFHPPRA
jgi:hypothetical protein